MAEVKQVRELSSEGQSFMAGSAEASVRSRLPLCGDPCFGFRSPGPGAEKDIEKRGSKVLCQGWATTRRPRSRGTGAHGPQGQKLGCGVDRRALATSLAWGRGQRGWPWLYTWVGLRALKGWDKIRHSEDKPTVARRPTHEPWACLPCNAVCNSDIRFQKVLRMLPQDHSRPAAKALKIQDGWTDVHPGGWLHLGFEKAAYSYTKSH